MLSYAIRRILLIIPTLLIVVIATFILIRLIPGDVVDIMQREMFSGSVSSGNVMDRAEIMHRLGLDVPIHIQFGRWLGYLPGPDPVTGEISYNGVLQGNLGTSLRTNRSMTDEIIARLPVSFELGLMAIIISNLIAIPIGIYSAVRQDTWLDYVSRTFAVIFLSVPNFWLATILITVGALFWNWSPAMEYVRFSENPLLNIKNLLLPATLMGLATAGATMRYLRTLTIETLRQDYIRTAWAKGLKERVIIFRHATKNALVPLVTIFAPMIGRLIGGAVITEQIFVIPGMGQFLLSQITGRDYWVVSGMNLIFALFTLSIILITDLSYGYLDPRVRYR